MKKLRYEEKVGYKQYPIFDVLFYGVLLTVLIMINPMINDNKTPIIIFFVLPIIVLAIFMLRLYLKKAYKILSIDDNLLKVETFFFIKTSSKEYKLEHIEDIKYVINEKSESYVSPVVFKIGGIKTSPKSTRIHGKNPSVVYFKYQNATIKIGEGLNKFDGARIIKLVNGE